MLHVIVVLALIKAVKFTVLYLCLLVRFSIIFQIKMFNQILFVAGWFGSTLYQTPFKIPMGRKIHVEKIVLEPER